LNVREKCQHKTNSERFTAIIIPASPGSASGAIAKSKNASESHIIGTNIE
jgi:hypothetical protein